MQILRRETHGGKAASVLENKQDDAWRPILEETYETLCNRSTNARVSLKHNYFIRCAVHRALARVTRFMIFIISRG